ncbi:MAG: HD domain-containing protein [Candidatus Woesearchaeota archaeon]
MVVNEPVFAELIMSAPLQRLKGINQAGPSQYVAKGKTATRYEHSIGVAMLLRKLGACIEEQIAGLLHDVAHTAYSHVADFVFENETQEVHEAHLERIIFESEIPYILRKHGFDAEKILEIERFTLLERPLPYLCADRVNYTLRDSAAMQNTTKDAQYFLEHLKIADNEIMMDSAEPAIRFGKLYLDLDKTMWADPREVAVVKIMAEAIQLALKSGELSINDLFYDDSHIANKLRKSTNERIHNKLSLLSPDLRVTEDQKHFDFFCRTKPRYINPKYINPKTHNYGLNRVTEVYPEFKGEIEVHKKRIQDGLYIRVLKPETKL